MSNRPTATPRSTAGGRARLGISARGTLGSLVMAVLLVAGAAGIAMLLPAGSDVVLAGHSAGQTQVR